MFFSGLIVILAVGVVLMFLAPRDGGFAQDIELEHSAPVENITKAPNAQKLLTHIPAFQLNGIGSADFTDDVMVLNFFSVWCDKCARENILFNTFVKKYDIPLYGINVHIKPTDDPVGFFNELGNPFKQWGKDDFRLISQALGINSIPVSMIITPNLKVHWRHDGELTDDIIERDMVPLLKDLAAPRSIVSLTHLPNSKSQQ